MTHPSERLLHRRRVHDIGTYDNRVPPRRAAPLGHVAGALEGGVPEDQLDVERVDDVVHLVALVLVDPVEEPGPERLQVVSAPSF